ncbi:site-2 protease family protein [Dictyobacter aurantiacus]|uniref:Zinc metalloprotease n=1 Tax=Dictyobacter aurantiacus TaxID=1936993 RepID=A0A401ZI45_9CHLR|nr:site-2 protease family protein [Dictyobacter aurantiacus]GCE06518.1 peptidase M50 [Dictyobacter aurantiacus]
MPGSLRIGKIAGIDIAFHVSWLIIAVLLCWSLATGWFGVRYPGWSTGAYWSVSVLATLLLFLSVFLHELAHALVARARGLQVKSITLFLFGGVSNIEQEPAAPDIEFQMALVGPLTSLALGGLSWLLALAIGHNGSPLRAIFEYLALANLLLGVFNMIPGFPLDGGRVLHSIIWKIRGDVRSATRVATGVGQFIAYFFIFIGLWIFFRGHVLDGLWIGFIGWFLLSGATAASAQGMLEGMFKGVRVDDVMNRSPATVPANISLQKLVDDYLLPYGWRSAFVLQGDQLAGLVALSDIRHVPREQWSQTPVGFVMVPLTRLHTINVGQSLNDVLPLMVGRDLNQLPVVSEGHLQGSISRENIMHFIEIKRSLGLDS